MWSAVLLAAAASGQDSMEDWFPTAPLTPAVLQERLTDEVLGPTATTYDHTKRTATLQDPVARRLEREALGERADALEAPDALRCYAKAALRLMRAGPLESYHQWILAEHCGLAQAPYVIGEFYANHEPGLTQSVNSLLKALDPDIRAVAVAVESADDGLTVGLIFGLFGTIAFEPFARVTEPGAVVRIPGTVLEAGGDYVLYVSTDGPEVREYPLEGQGAFDIEFPLPEVPGPYRVAMSRHEEGSLPDDPFFFTLYAGVDPPEVAVPDFGSDLDAPAEAVEAKVVEAINEDRLRHGLEPLAVAGSPSLMRSLLADMPTTERAAWRYLRREMSRDPLPGESHGLWVPGISTNSRSAAAASWMLLEHPAFRRATLSPTMDRLVLGVHQLDDGLRVALVTVEPPPDAASASEAAREQLTSRWPSGAPQPAPRLEAALNDLAARVASGELKQKKLSGELKKLTKKGLVRGGMQSVAYFVPPGEVVDTSDIALADWAKHLAIGGATGDLGTGDGISYAVTLVLAAQNAD
jgi:hypothetical protein